MLVLGIESTCDETGFSIVANGKEILSNLVASQERIHRNFGGVIPELACRQHIDHCLPLFEKALLEANVTHKQIDVIAVANGPGLIGAVLIGVHFAKGLAFGLHKPLVAVNHIEAHLYATLMESTPPLPALGVVISGGHTALLVIEKIGCYHLIGQTQDDAIGEAFDKAAKLLDLPYPGGPEIEKLALGANPHKFSLKAGQIKNRPLDFSFSGLKTALFYLVKGQNGEKNGMCLLNESDKKDAAASFQLAAFSDLVEKINKASFQFNCKSIVVGGGVSQNLFFRTHLSQKTTLPFFLPPKGLCLDNAAMIAGLGYHVFKERGPTQDLKAFSRIPLCQLGL